MDPEFQRQLQLEAEMAGLGQRRVEIEVMLGRDIPDAKHIGQLRHKKSHQEAHTEAMTGYGRTLLATAIERVGLACEAEANTVTPGPLALHRTMLRRFWGEAPIVKGKKPTEKEQKALARWESQKAHHMRIVAAIALEVMVNGISSTWKVTQTAGRIGMALERELKFRHARAHNPGLFETVLKDLRRREPDMQRRELIMSHSLRTDSTQQALRGWRASSQSALFAVGMLMLTTICRETDLMTIVSHRERKNKTVDVLAATPSTLDYIHARMANAGWANPLFLPTVIKPLPWTSMRSGGYYSMKEALEPVRLVKKLWTKNAEGKARFIRLERTVMPEVYRAVNAVQNTGWRINKALLTVMQEAWYHGGCAIGKMPIRTTAETFEAAFPLPPRMPEGATEEEKTARNRVASKVYRRREAQIGRVFQMDRTMMLAEKFAGEQAIYFPTQLDFRGRMYAMPSILNPQGTDCAKGLLEFAEGKRLGPAGWRWLHIHVANMHGEDKVSFEEREQWTITNFDWISSCVKDPFTTRGWMEADKPWQFLAGAMELVAAVESGDYENYFSHLPVTVDGTCNGLQHFSAMLLDQDGADSVNLSPSEVPSDIYQIVANKVKAKFALMDDPMAKQWLAWGFDRKATKRAVMILPYSGTQHAATEYIREYVKERMAAENPGAQFEDEFQAAVFFAKHVWATIGETIQSAGTVMKWLKEIAKAVTKAKHPIRWTTPMGFPVEQDKREEDQFRLDLSLGKGIRYRPILSKESERFDRKAQAQGISPNFVHSLDAACLMLTINRALDEEITSFAMVHDSYGVHACDMDKLYVGLRQAFVDIYQGDVMGDFVRQATEGLPEEVRNALIAAQPPKGTFVLESVKESKYFFA